MNPTGHKKTHLGRAGQVSFQTDGKSAEYSAELHVRFDELMDTSFFTLAKHYFHFPSK